MVSIAVLDDGLNGNIDLLQIPVSFFIIKNGVIRKKVTSDFSEKLTHSTMCTYIIKEIYSNIKIIDIQILDDTGRGSIEQLIVALEWCEKNGIKIIHMSLCTCNYHDFVRLDPIIKRMTQNGFILICAVDNRNIPSFPAMMPGVIGVINDSEGILKSKEFSMIKYGGTQKENIYLAHYDGYIERGEYKKNLRQSNSFAAPVITGHIAKLLADVEEYDLNKVIEKLNKDYYYKNLDKENKKICKEFNGGSLEVPIILFEKCNYECVKDFANQFQKLGYRVEIFSENSSDKRVIPITIYTEHFGTINNKVLYLWEQIYRPDIIIIFKNTKYGSDNSELSKLVDIKISIVNNQIILNNENFCKKFKNIEQLELFIIDYFS